MKRKVDWEEEEQSKREDYSDEESGEEEPRIKDVLDNLFHAVSRKRASELLHNMATSKDILFWTPRGQLLRHQRLIPVTNISELIVSRSQCRRRVVLGTGVRQVNYSEVLGEQQDLTLLLESGKSDYLQHLR